MGNKNMKLIKDKRGLEFKSAYFAVVVVSMLVIAVGVMISEWNEDYSSGITYDLGEYNRLNDTTSTASEYEGNISVRSSTEGENFEGTALRAVFGFLNNIFKPFRIVFGQDGMIASITERVGAPSWLRQGIINLMIFSVLFTLVAIFFKLPRSSA